MSATFGLPLMVDGSQMSALVVGGGMVATRKAAALRDGGATVRVRAPRVSDELTRRAAGDERLLIEQRPYDRDAIGDAMLVVAATDDPALNVRIGGDARGARRLVLVSGEPGAGNCALPAVHRSGNLVIAVASGGVPRASKRVRDALAQRLDNRYADAIRALAGLRQRLLAGDDRAAWRAAADVLLAEDFCESVENGAFSERLASWR